MSGSLRYRAKSGRVSFALIASYFFDWIIVLLTAGMGAYLSTISPNKRPFSLVDPDISFPYVTKEKISTAVLAIISLAIPAIVIFFVALLLVPGPTVSKATPKGLIWRRKLWEWHTGWLGLALALAAAFFITDGMKNLFGRPRPDLISRCKPDVANISKYAVGGYGTTEGTYQLVSAAICTQTDSSILDDGFRSFPSGHASFSAAGLIYLSLFLASKLAITIPFLSPAEYSADASRFSAFPSRAERKAARRQAKSQSSDGPLSQPSTPSGHDDRAIAARNQAAAPPVYLLVLAVIPFFASIYIASTRFSDFRHHAFDILFGYFIGAVSAVFAFRFYHLPISQGAGWSWGPRSRDRSFWAGVGVGSYSNNGLLEAGAAEEDLERGTMGETLAGGELPGSRGRIKDDSGGVSRLV